MDFSIGDKKFKLSKIDALKQFHIVRRIGPLISEILPVLTGIAKVPTDSMSESQKLDMFAKIAEPLMGGLSKLSDEDANFVLFRLLSSAEIYQDNFKCWAKIASDQGIQMQDLDLPILLQCAGRALMFNLAGFFGSLPRQ